MPKARGTAINPPNRFERLHVEPLDDSTELEPDLPDRLTQFFVDNSKSILSENDSPDVPFTYSINPYRGCEHGCVYCYARADHEYLGFSAGLDFESKILVKTEAPRLLQEALSASNWNPQTICLSGDTDCYQPAERRLQLTRQCLEVFAAYRNPVSIITKNALVQRDIDLLKDLAHDNLVTVTMTITTLDDDLIRTLEPRTSRAGLRLSTIRTLADNGIPVGVSVAPIIPGLTDQEIPAILYAAAENGARYAGYIILRLPHAVREVFMEWLERELPLKAHKIRNRITDFRGGRVSNYEWGTRTRGKGPSAVAVRTLFEQALRRSGLSSEKHELSNHHFRIPLDRQLDLFH